MRTIQIQCHNYINMALIIIIKTFTSLTEPTINIDMCFKGANENHENVLSDAADALVQVMVGAYCLILMFVIAHY